MPPKKRFKIADPSTLFYLTGNVIQSPTRIPKRTRTWVQTRAFSLLTYTCLVSFYDSAYIVNRLQFVIVANYTGKWALSFFSGYSQFGCDPHVVYSETLLTSMLENLYFDFRIAPAMCKLWVGKCAPTEMIAWIEKPLIYSYSTRRQRGANRAPGF